MRKFLTEVMRFTIFIIYVAVFVFLFTTLVRQDDGIGMLDSVEPICIHGTASVDGGPQQLITNTLWENDIHRTLVITGKFNRYIGNGDSIILWPRNLRVRLYVNGVEKLSVGQRESFPEFIEYAGNSFQFFYIGEVTPDDIIQLKIEKAYESCRINVITSFFNNIYIGKEHDVYQSILANEIIHPLIGLVLTFVGCIALLTSLIQRYTHFHQIHPIVYLAWFCIIGGITYACDSAYEFIDLLFPYPVFNTLLDLCCIPLLVLTYVLFIANVLEDRKTRKFIRLIAGIFIILEAIPVLLQIFGIRDLHELQDSYVIMGAFVVFLCIGTLLYEIIYLKKSEQKKILIASIPLMFSLTLKVVNVILEQGVERTYLRLGILTSCLMLLSYTVKYVKRSLELMAQEQQMKQEMQNAHIAIMLSQIQPHFLYNALNALQHICQKDGALAAEAIEHFSRYLRGNMNSLTNERPISFEQELEHVKHYLYIEQLRFGERIHVEYDLELTNFYIPTLTLQPIVENAIRHGITKQAEGGTIRIITKQMGEEILIIVSDNGIGFDINEKKNDERFHIGIDNVRKRLKLQCDGTLDLISKKGIGTQVTIRMKGANSKTNERNGC